MNRSMCQSAQDYFTTMNSVISAIDYKIIDEVVVKLVQAQKENRKIFVFGNGGSASTSGHFGLEFVMTGAPGGPKALQVHSLSDNVGLLTALANDTSYDEIFSYQLNAYAAAGDVAIAITGSGNSPNIVNACQWAKENEVFVIALTGFGGGKVKELADIQIHIPSDNYGIIEDLHMSIGHIIGQRLHQIL